MANWAGLGRRADRPARPVRLAPGHAGHRPQGTPPPGAQLRLIDVDGNRVTCFATRARHGQLADLELAHRRRARCEDRIRCAKDTGLRALPLHGLAQNQAWCELAALAGELTARAQMLALHDTPARRWEPRRLRFRLFTTAGRWRLAEMRKRRGMTQEQVATRMGISIARVSQIESGDVSTQDVLNRFITALGGTLKLIADFGDEQLKIA